jgi:RNA polymerase sigma factor (sigma-70 family)
VQSTFLNAHRALQRGVLPETELAWLLKIAQNVCLTRRRSTQRRGRVEAAHDLESMQDYLAAPQRESPDELIGLTDALEDLPDSQRRAILLREWQGLSYAEIARELKLTQSAVETLIFRARRSLAANLEVVVGKPRLLARARHALELGWLVPALRALFEGGVAVKAATAAAAVSSAAVIATSSDAPAPRPEPKAVSAVVGVEQATQRPPAVERPRLQERAAPLATPRSIGREQRRKAVAKTLSAAPASAPKVAKAKPSKSSRAHAPKVAKPKPQRSAKPKPVKAKRVVPHVRKKPKPKPKAKQAAPPTEKQPKAEGPPEKADKPAPEPGSGKSK